jgi:hypothetical protein
MAGTLWIVLRPSEVGVNRVDYTRLLGVIE